MPDPTGTGAEERRGPNPSGLCMCGCGQRTNLAPFTNRNRGWYKDQPLRYVKNHRSRVDYVEDPETGCWVWEGCTERWGYGKTWRDGRHWLAHRWMYEQENGPVPDGLELDHLCENKRCVNPEHLEAVTHTVNVRRARSRLNARREAA